MIGITAPARATIAPDRRETQMWEKRMEWPLTGVAVLFLGAYAWPILQPSLGSTGRVWCEVVTWLAWGLFALDYVVRLVQSPDKPRFLRRHVLDLLVIVLPLLRPLRLLRLVAMLNVLNRTAALALRGRVVVYFVGATALIVFCAALAVLEAERPIEEAGIRNFPDALWWAITTITTVGYGDRYPVSGTGRLIAVGLMVAGIALLGVVTATFASWLVRRVEEVEAASQTVTRAEIAELSREIAELRAALAASERKET
ncbi:potassium channel family protein [Amycolatopsis tucumanensis]|uniref:Potassium channel family protein n=1 Tax=Amycolatopsis tucumanensis TaxID=401106 RepID=A0ABP7HV57_9PSEU|nr:potassium channel family protein [Amycolatopsis tucumanensis]MCF6421963.1 potassium channel family protein [Amycolatopsis tucumanensis]